MHFESYSALEAHVTAGCKCVGSVLMQGEARVGEGVGKGIQRREGGRLALHRTEIINVPCRQPPLRQSTILMA